MAKRVAIVGAGSSGLTAIKACLEEGLEPVCFEVTNEVGGLWKYREEDVDGLASVMKGTYMNTSKEMSAFSDYPPPEDFPNYMPHQYVHKYLTSYAVHFDLRRHVKFQHRVLKITPDPNYEENGRWSVRTQDERNDQLREETFDAVMISAGHHVYPHMPDIPGLDKFRGKKIHSRTYKRPEPFEGAHALVIGMGNSGVDIAVELSRVAKKVYLSSRHGGWIHNRLGKGGKPFDLQFYRWKDIMLKGLSSLNRIFDKAEEELNFKVDHEFYRLKPAHRIYNQYTIINDELPVRLLNGTVKLKNDIERFTESGVVFKGDERVYDLDLVVLATGYDLHYPFLDEQLVDFRQDVLEIYRFVFPANLSHPSTLSFVGLIDPEGSVFTVAEMQSRWIVRVLNGQAKLPTKDSMMYTIRKTGKLLRKWSYEGNRHKTRIFWLFYMEKLADYIGVKPNFRRLFRTDWSLFWSCFAGPVMAYQYRVHGPHAWSGARGALLNYEDRVNRPLRLAGHENQTSPGAESKCKETNLNKGVRLAIQATFFSIVLVVSCYLATS